MPAEGEKGAREEVPSAKLSGEEAGISECPENCDQDHGLNCCHGLDRDDEQDWWNESDSEERSTRTCRRGGQRPKAEETRAVIIPWQEPHGERSK